MDNWVMALNKRDAALGLIVSSRRNGITGSDITTRFRDARAFRFDLDTSDLRHSALCCMIIATAANSGARCFPINAMEAGNTLELCSGFGASNANETVAVSTRVGSCNVNRTDTRF